MKTIKRKIHGQKKSKQSATEPAVSKVLAEELMRFIEYHPAGRFKRNLRKMLFEFLMSGEAVESFYLKDLLYDLDGLFELLDVIEEEVERQG